METKELQEVVETNLKGFKSDIQKEVEAKSLELGKSVDEIKSELKANQEANQKHLDAMDLLIQAGVQEKKSKKFADILGESLGEKQEELSKLSKTKSKLDFGLELKVAGEMTPENFTVDGYGAMTTQVRQGVYMDPFSPLWLRNILPTATTNSAALQYLRENGGEGAAELWDGTGDKSLIDYDFELITDTVKWIAGIVRIPREMLDDVAWLRSFISQQITFGKRGLWVAENAKISSVLAANSTAFNGDANVPVEMLYQAAFGQLRDNYHNPTHMLLNHNDSVKIMLNKASGSGEYDLPQGTVGMINGQLTIGGVPVIGVPNIEAGTFTVLDASKTQFISRMSPEVRFFEEDRDNVIKNLITVRAEERVATLVFDSSAVIRGTFGA